MMEQRQKSPKIWRDLAISSRGLIRFGEISTRFGGDLIGSILNLHWKILGFTRFGGFQGWVKWLKIWRRNPPIDLPASVFEGGDPLLAIGVVDLVLTGFNGSLDNPNQNTYDNVYYS